MDQNPFEPALFVFSNRRRDRIKLLFWDRNGFWLMMNRLEADRFRWPRQEALLVLSMEQLHWLLEAIDLAVMRPIRSAAIAKLAEVLSSTL